MSLRVNLYQCYAEQTVLVRPELLLKGRNRRAEEENMEKNLCAPGSNAYYAWYHVLKEKKEEDMVNVTRLIYLFQGYTE